MSSINNKQNILYNNPLLSTTLTVDDLIKDAVLLQPALPSQGPELQGCPTLSPSPSSCGGDTGGGDASSKSTTMYNSCNMNENVGDDFDFAAYYARLHSIPDIISSSITKQKTQSDSKQENIDEFAEIDLHSPLAEGDAGETQSYAADLADNLSQLPNVLPHVANTVFSSFTNIWNKTKTKNEDFKNIYNDSLYEEVTSVLSDEKTVIEGHIEPVPLLDAMSYNVPPKRNSVTQTAPLTVDSAANEYCDKSFNKLPTNACSNSESGLFNAFRISSSKAKKMYAKVPGLTLGETEYPSQKPTIPSSELHLPPLPAQSNSSFPKHPPPVSGMNQQPTAGVDNGSSIHVSEPYSTNNNFSTSIQAASHVNIFTPSMEETLRENTHEPRVDCAISNTPSSQYNYSNLQLPPTTPLNKISGDPNKRSSYSPRLFFKMLKTNSPLLGPKQLNVTENNQTSQDSSSVALKTSISETTKSVFDTTMWTTPNINVESILNDSQDTQLEANISLSPPTPLNPLQTTESHNPHNVDFLNPVSVQNPPMELVPSTCVRKLSNASNSSDHSLNSAMSKLNTSDKTILTLSSIPPPPASNDPGNKFRLSSKKRFQYYAGPLSGKTFEPSLAPLQSDFKTTSEPQIFSPTPANTNALTPALFTPDSSNNHNNGTIIFTPNSTTDVTSTDNNIYNLIPCGGAQQIATSPSNMDVLSRTDSYLCTNVPDISISENVKIFTPVLDETKSYTPVSLNKPEVYSPEHLPYLPPNPSKTYHMLTNFNKDSNIDDANIQTNDEDRTSASNTNSSLTNFKLTTALEKIHQKVNLNKIHNVVTSFFDPYYFKDQNEDSLEDFTIQTDNNYTNLTYPNSFNSLDDCSVSQKPNMLKVGNGCDSQQLPNSQQYVELSSPLQISSTDECLQQTNCLYEHCSSSRDAHQVLPHTEQTSVSNLTIDPWIKSSGSLGDYQSDGCRSKIHRTSFDELPQVEISGDEKRICLESYREFVDMEGGPLNNVFGMEYSNQVDKTNERAISETGNNTNFSSDINNLYTMTSADTSSDRDNVDNDNKIMEDYTTLPFKSQIGSLNTKPQGSDCSYVFTSDAKSLTPVSASGHKLFQEFEAVVQQSGKKQHNETIAIGDAATFFDSSEPILHSKEMETSVDQCLYDGPKFFTFDMFGKSSSELNSKDHLNRFTTKNNTLEKDVSCDVRVEKDETFFHHAMANPNTKEILNEFHHLSDSLENAAVNVSDATFSDDGIIHEDNINIMNTDSYNDRELKYKNISYSQEIEECLPLVTENAPCTGEYYEDECNIWGLKNAQPKDMAIYSKLAEDGDSSENDSPFYFKPILLEDEEKNADESVMDDNQSEDSDCPLSEIEYEVLDDSFASFPDEFLNEVAQMIENPNKDSLCEKSVNVNDLKNLDTNKLMLRSDEVSHVESNQEVHVGSDTNNSKHIHDSIGEIDSKTIMNIMKGMDIFKSQRTYRDKGKRNNDKPLNNTNDNSKQTEQVACSKQGNQNSVIRKSLNGESSAFVLVTNSRLPSFENTFKYSNCESVELNNFSEIFEESGKQVELIGNKQDETLSAPHSHSVCLEKNLDSMESFSETSDEEIQNLTKNDKFHDWDNNVIDNYDFDNSECTIDNFLNSFDSMNVKDYNIKGIEDYSVDGFENDSFIGKQIKGRWSKNLSVLESEVKLKGEKSLADNVAQVNSSIISSTYTNLQSQEQLPHKEAEGESFHVQLLNEISDEQRAIDTGVGSDSLTVRKNNTGHGDVGIPLLVNTSHFKHQDFNIAESNKESVLENDSSSGNDVPLFTAFKYH